MAGEMRLYFIAAFLFVDRDAAPMVRLATNFISKAQIPTP
jgi:hypothetical protein